MTAFARIVRPRGGLARAAFGLACDLVHMGVVQAVLPMSSRTFPKRNARRAYGQGKDRRGIRSVTVKRTENVNICKGWTVMKTHTSLECFIQCLASVIFCVAVLLFCSPDVRADARPPQSVTAVWRTSQHLDLFMTNDRGEVSSAWFEPGCGWQPWFSIHPESGEAAPGQPVTAVWRNANHLDLFMTGKDGRVMSAFFEGNSWQPWFAISPESAMATAGQPVTAVWRNADHLDLFMTDKDGRVVSTFFEKDAWQPWFAIPSHSAMAIPGQPITAVWRNANHLDLFMTRQDGRVVTTFFEDNSWQPDWIAIHPESAEATSGQPITAVWRNADHLDLFMTGKDGRVMSAFFEGNS